MVIIGEKINGTRKEVAAAIAARDEGRIRALAREQVEGGAHYLDVNAEVEPAKEPEVLSWLVKIVQDEVDVPLSLDTANPAALQAALEVVASPPIVNSISGERRRLEGMLPVAAAHGCPVILLALEDGGMPRNVEDRMRAIEKLFVATRHAGIEDGKVYVDPMILAVATGDEQAGIALETMRQVRGAYPQAHLTAGASNISYGLPGRTLLNRAFLVLAIAAGLDSVIADPCERDLMGTILAAEVLTGKDRFCRSYTTAYRNGRLGPVALSRA